jgi:hypothetical protein
MSGRHFLINKTISTPNGMEGTIVSVDEEQKVLKARMETGEYPDLYYCWGDNEDAD